MRRLRQLRRLSSLERGLLARALLLVLGVRLGLWLLPLKAVRRGLSRVAHASPTSACNDEGYLDQAAWAVTVASRYVPQATCLTRALAAQALLAWNGYASVLRIGFAREQRGPLEGHAWLESQGRVVLGGGELSRFTLAMVPE